MDNGLLVLHALNETDAAAAWRLAGAQALCAAASDAARTLAEARSAAAMLVLSPRFAAQLPPALLDEALAAPRPLAVILPAASPLAADPAERVRRQLGLDPGA